VKEGAEKYLAARSLDSFDVRCSAFRVSSRRSIAKADRCSPCERVAYFRLLPLLIAPIAPFANYCHSTAIVPDRAKSQSRSMHYPFNWTVAFDVSPRRSMAKAVRVPNSDLRTANSPQRNPFSFNIGCSQLQPVAGGGSRAAVPLDVGCSMSRRAEAFAKADPRSQKTPRPSLARRHAFRYRLRLNFNHTISWRT
jgi:hypothetical protein